MASFPAYARVLIAGFGEQRESALLRTEMESGPPRQVKIKSRVMVTRRVNIYLGSKADYNSYVAWFRDTIHEGADWFDWLDPISNTTKSVRFVGGGIEAMLQGQSSGLWIIPATVEGWGI